MGQRPASASADDQDLTQLARNGGQRGAGLAARPRTGSMVRSVGGLSPGSLERLPLVRASSVQTRRR